MPPQELRAFLQNVDELEPHPDNLRKDRPKEVIENLAGHMAIYGQLFPLLVVGKLVLDGVCRLLAMPLACIKQAWCIDVGGKNPEEIVLIQLGIDEHRLPFSKTERSLAMVKLEENGMEQKEI